MQGTRGSEDVGQGWRATVICAAVGAVLAGLLWLAWQPTTVRCDEIGSCLSRVFVALVLSAAALPVGALALWLLQVRPVVTTSLLGFVGTGALVLTAGDLAEVPRTLPSSTAPVWAWVAIGAVMLPLAHWMVQPGRTWWVRVLPVVAVVALSVVGAQWADRARDSEELDRFAAVGLDPVVVPELHGYAPELAWPREAAEDLVPPEAHVRLSLRPTDGDTFVSGPEPDDNYSREITAYLIPMQGRAACDLAVAAEGTGPNRRDCADDGEAVRTETWSGSGEQVMRVGAGVAHGDTLVYLSVDAAAGVSVEDLARAARDARPTTLEALRDL